MRFCTILHPFTLVICFTVAASGADPILAPGATPQLLQETGAGEGPAWHPELGLLTSGEGNIMRRDRKGKMSIYRQDAGSNGLLFDRQGRLVICESAFGPCSSVASRMTPRTRDIWRQMPVVSACRGLFLLPDLAGTSLSPVPAHAGGRPEVVPVS